MESDKVWYEGRVQTVLKSFQEWSDMADEANISEAARVRRLGHAAEALAVAAQIADKADRKGITLDVSLAQLTVTRVKLKEEIRLLQERCEAMDKASETLSAQVIDLRAEVTRVNSACAEIDSDWEVSYRRLERVAFAAAVVTFVVGIAFGMMF